MSNDEKIFQDAFAELKKSKFPEDCEYTPEQDAAVETMYAIRDSYSPDARIVTIDKTSEKDGKICGITITDGRGSTLFDDEINPGIEINREHAQKNGLDIEKINRAKKFEERYAEIHKQFERAEAIWYEAHADYELFKTELKNLEKPENISKSKLLLAITQEAGISLTKCCGNILNAFEMYKRPSVLTFIKAISDGFCNRMQRQQRFNKIRKLFNDHLKEIERYRKEKADLKSKIKESKKIGNTAWKRAERPSLEYAKMTRQERRAERILAQVNTVNPLSQQKADQIKKYLSGSESQKKKIEIQQPKRRR